MLKDGAPSFEKSNNWSESHLFLQYVSRKYSIDTRN